MIDYNRIVGELRVFLQTTDRTPQPRLAVLATNYAAAIAEANERLNRCGMFLRQGLRSEALHLARDAPDLLDMVAVLDFPERAEWDELAMAQGWSAAPALALELAAALNEAHSAEDPLRDLLRAHRRLALARAPLPARLDVLRKIAALDANSPIWAEDVRRFEAARFDQLADEVRRARAVSNERALAAIVAELEAPDRLLATPPALLKGVRDAADEARRANATQTLENLLPALHRAFQSKDGAQGRKLRADWLAQLDAAELPRGHPLRGHAQVALDWLDQEDRRAEAERAYRETIADLEDAIDGGAAADLLDELEREALRFGPGLPVELQARLKDRRRVLGRVARLRQRALLGAVAACCLGLVALVAWSNASGRRSHAVDQAAYRIASALDAGKLEEARTALDAVERDYSGAGESDALAPAVTRLVAAERKETDRALGFHKALDEARAAALVEESPPALETARTLARLDAEKAGVETLAASRRARLDAERAEVDRTLQPILDALPLKTGKLEARIKQAPDSKETQASLAALRAEFDTFKAESARAGTAVRQQVKYWLERFAALDTAHGASKEQHRLLDDLMKASARINDSAGLGEYIDLCHNYVERHPADPRARSLRTVLDERFGWLAAVAWAELVRGWPASPLALSPKDAEARLAQLKQYLTDHARRPDAATIDAYYQYVDSVARRAAVRPGNPDLSLIRLVTSQPSDPVWWLKTRNGKTYYSKAKPANKGRAWELVTVLSFDGREKTVSVLQENFLSQDLAPQSRFAALTRERLAKTGRDEPQAAWESAVVELLERLRLDPDLDPILKVVLLKGMSTVAMQGSVALKEALAGQVKALDRARVDPNVSWLDPEARASDQERQLARALFDKLPSFAPCGKAVEHYREALDSALGRRYWPVGSLWKDDDGAWACPVRAPTAPDAELFLLSPGGAWSKVGRVTGGGGKLTLDAAAPPLAEGRLLFIAKRAT